jgi:hypothetical protein
VRNEAGIFMSDKLDPKTLIDHLMQGFDIRFRVKPESPFKAAVRWIKVLSATVLIGIFLGTFVRFEFHLPDGWSAPEPQKAAERTNDPGVRQADWVTSNHAGVQPVDTFGFRPATGPRWRNCPLDEWNRPLRCGPWQHGEPPER